MGASSAEVAKLFGVAERTPSNAGAAVYPSYPRIVVAAGEVRSMTWGFPLVPKGKYGQPLKPKAVKNTRADKLDSFTWSKSGDALYQ
jgi:hypothetical protein